MVISQEGKKRKAVEDFINDFKFPAKKERPSQPGFATPKSTAQGVKLPAKNGAAEVSVTEFQSPAKPSKRSLSSSDTDSDRLEFVIDTKGDEGLRVEAQPNKISTEKKKKKKAKSYLDDL